MKVSLGYSDYVKGRPAFQEKQLLTFFWNTYISSVIEITNSHLFHLQKTAFLFNLNSKSSSLPYSLHHKNVLV